MEYSDLSGTTPNYHRKIKEQPKRPSKKNDSSFPISLLYCTDSPSRVRIHDSSDDSKKEFRTSSPTSPKSPKRPAKIVPKRPFASGVGDLDVEIAIITRSLDRIVQKKLENLLSTDAIRAAIPYVPVTSPISVVAQSLLPPIAASAPSSPPESALVAAPVQISNVTADGENSSTEHKEEEGLSPTNNDAAKPKERKHLTYVQHSDSVIPNPNISDGLDFEVSMILRSLERLSNRLLDSTVREQQAQSEISELQDEIQTMKQEREVLLFRASLNQRSHTEDSTITDLGSSTGSRAVIEMRKKSIYAVASKLSVSVTTQTENENFQLGKSGGFPEASPASSSAKFGSMISSKAGTSTSPAMPDLTVVAPTKKASVSSSAGGSSSPAELEGATTTFKPTEDPYPLSCWSRITRCVKSKKGEFEFRVHVDSKLPIIHEAALYGIQYMAELLLAEARPVIIVREFSMPLAIAMVRKPATLGRDKLLNLGVALNLDIIHFDAEMQRKRYEQTHSPNSSRTMAPISNRYSSLQKLEGPTALNSSPTLSVIPREKTKSVPERNGILHFIGCKLKLFSDHLWENPLSQKRVFVTSSSVWGVCEPKQITGMDAGFFMTCNVERSWIQIDLLCGAVIPTGYSLASTHPIYSGYYPRNWEIHASLDGKRWRKLRKHVNDETVDHSHLFGFWELDLDSSSFVVGGDSSTDNVTLDAPYFRYFRILQTGPNSFGSHELQISSLEIYGKFMYITSDTAKSAPPPVFKDPRPEPSETIPLPQPQTGGRSTRSGTLAGSKDKPRRKLTVPLGA